MMKAYLILQIVVIQTLIIVFLIIIHLIAIHFIVILLFNIFVFEFSILLTVFGFNLAAIFILSKDTCSNLRLLCSTGWSSGSCVRMGIFWGTGVYLVLFWCFEGSLTFLAFTLSLLTCLAD